jgi:hypothetical protein
VYVYECAGCNHLGTSERSDCLTCSPACRVRAHRSGALKKIRSDAAQCRKTPALLQHAKAMKKLLPDRYDEMVYGKMGEVTPEELARGRSFFNNQPDILKAFYDLLDKELEATA